MKKRNILIIADLHTLTGGSFTFLHGFVKKLLDQKNISIYLITFYHSELSISSIFPQSSNLHHYNLIINLNHRLKPTPKRIYLLNQVLFQLDHISFTLIFTDLVCPTFAFQIARIFHPRLRHVPLYHHIHGSSFSEEIKSQTLQDQSPSLYQKIRLKLFYYLEHFVLKSCQRIFVNSYYSMKFTKKLHGNLPLEINKPGIDFSFSSQIRKIDKSTARVRLGLNPQGKYILLTSRIEPIKGIITFFKNISSSTFPYIKLLVCSNFVESPFLHDLLMTLNRSQLGSNTFLINNPSRDQLSLLYRAANVTVMPSVGLETFGFSTLESYYFGTPVVAFNIGANSELIPSSHLVKYPSKHSWPNLYQKINQVLNNPGITDYSKYNYSWMRYIKKLLLVY